MAVVIDLIVGATFKCYLIYNINAFLHILVFTHYYTFLAN